MNCITGRGQLAVGRVDGAQLDRDVWYSLPLGGDLLLLLLVVDDRHRDQPVGGQRPGVGDGVEHAAVHAGRRAPRRCGGAGASR